MPLLPWVEQFLYPERPTLSLASELCISIGVGVAYIGIALSWWHVRGEPPYPVLRAVQQEGMQTHFYSLMLGFEMCVTICAYAWRSNAPIISSKGE
jgi:hypothetical protein